MADDEVDDVKYVGVYMLDLIGYKDLKLFSENIFKKLIIQRKNILHCNLKCLVIFHQE